MGIRVCLEAEYCNNRFSNSKARYNRVYPLMRLFIALSSVLAILLVFSACGKTGDLYLPEDKASAEEPSVKATGSTEK